MRLFHGSKDGIEGAIATLGRGCCDFGRGFYLGDELPEMAENLRS